MSCRRSDIAALRGCKIGEVGVRGCSRGCCPYPDSERSQNIRFHLEQQGAEHRDRVTPHPMGRDGLYYDRCMTAYRPKFICARPTCRRMVKPYFDEERNEYRISEWGDWSVRPLLEHSAGLREAIRNEDQLKKGRLDLVMGKVEELKRRQLELEEKDWWGPEAGEGGELFELSEEETAFLRKHDPEMWWTEILRIPMTGSMNERTGKRCPSCGGTVIRVGSNFRIPKKSDGKAWKDIEDWMEHGVDLVGKFSTCANVEQHEEMVVEALMCTGSKKNLSRWEEEKRMRIEGLGLKWEPRLP